MIDKETSVLESIYIQKSTLFLLPLTGLEKNKYFFKKCSTYTSAPDLISEDYPNGIAFDDRILIVTYPRICKDKQDSFYNQITSNFKNIQIDETGWDKYETTLMSNKNFMAFHETDDEFIYTYDLSKWSKDWYCFMKGRYSLMTSVAKETIKKYRWDGLRDNERRKLFCYLYSNEDESCFKDFAEQLGEPIEVLKEVGQLCSKPNLKLETFKLSEKKELNET